MKSENLKQILRVILRRTLPDDTHSSPGAKLKLSAHRRNLFPDRTRGELIVLTGILWLAVILTGVLLISLLVALQKASLGRASATESETGRPKANTTTFLHVELMQNINNAADTSGQNPTKGYTQEYEDSLASNPLHGSQKHYKSSKGFRLLPMNASFRIRQSNTSKEGKSTAAKPLSESEDAPKEVSSFSSGNLQGLQSISIVNSVPSGKDLMEAVMTPPRVLCTPSSGSLSDDLFSFSSALETALESQLGLLLPENSQLRKVFSMGGRFTAFNYACIHLEKLSKPTLFPTYMREELRQHLSFVEELKKEVSFILRDLMQKSPAKSSPATVIGIHLDLRQELRDLGGKLGNVLWKFLMRAMTHFDNKYPNTIYVVIVEDPRTKNAVVLNLTKAGINVREYQSKKFSTPFVSVPEDSLIFPHLTPVEEDNTENHIDASHLDGKYQSSSSQEDNDVKPAMASQTSTIRSSKEGESKTSKDSDSPPVKSVAPNVPSVNRKKRHAHKNPLKHKHKVIKRFVNYLSHPFLRQKRDMKNLSTILSQTETQADKKSTAFVRKTIPTKSLGAAAGNRHAKTDNETQPERVGESDNSKIGLEPPSNKKHAGAKTSPSSEEKKTFAGPEVHPTVFNADEGLTGAAKAMQPSQARKALLANDTDAYPSSRRLEAPEQTRANAGKYPAAPASQPSKTEDSLAGDRGSATTGIGTSVPPGIQKMMNDSTERETTLAGALNPVGTLQDKGTEQSVVQHGWMKKNETRQNDMKVKAQSETGKRPSFFLEQIKKLFLKAIPESIMNKTKTFMLARKASKKFFSKPDDYAGSPGVKDERSSNGAAADHTASHKSLRVDKLDLPTGRAKDEKKMPKTSSAQKMLGPTNRAPSRAPISPPAGGKVDDSEGGPGREIWDALIQRARQLHKGGTRAHDSYGDKRGQVYVLNSLSPDLVLALLAHCNHTVLTPSGPGWWGALLGGGEVVYPRPLASRSFLDDPLGAQPPLPLFPEWRGV